MNPYVLSNPWISRDVFQYLLDRFSRHPATRPSSSSAG